MEYHSTVRARAAPLAIAFVGLVGYLPGLGSIATSLDERIYADVAKGMAVDGHWLVPRYTGEVDVVAGTVFLEKPPVVFWIQALSMEVFGPTQFAARLPTVLAAVACALLVCRIGTNWYDRPTGFAAGLVFLTTPAIFWYGNGGRTATTDVFLTLFGTCFVWYVWRARDDSRYLLYAGVAGGLAVMTKQVAAGVSLLIALPILARLLLDRRAADRRFDDGQFGDSQFDDSQFDGGQVENIGRNLASCLAAGALVVLPWNAYALRSYPDRYVDQMIVEQVLGRVGTGHAPLHRQVGETLGPFNPYYLQQFSIYLGPFVVTTVLGCVLALGDLRRSSEEDDREQRRLVGAVCCWWLFLPLAFYTIATSATWIHYVMPAVVPASILSGHVASRAIWAVRDLDGDVPPVDRTGYLGYVCGGAMVALVVLAAYPPHQNGMV